MHPEKEPEPLSPVSTSLDSEPDRSYDVDGLFGFYYEEFSRRAAAELRRDRNATIDAAELVSEVFLKLRMSPDFASKSAGHQMAIAAKAMRHVLVDRARRRLSERRGGAEKFTTLGDTPTRQVLTVEQILDLNRALDKLALESSRHAEIVELHYFAGQNMAEVAKALEISKKTVERDWIAARAWLGKEMRGTGNRHERR